MDATIHMITLARQGDTRSEAKIIEQNTGLVHSIIRRFLNSGVDYEDLFQIGCIGLLKAVRNFDTARGVMFSTYAVPMIIGEIRKFLRDDGAVKVSRSIREQYIRLRRAAQELRAEYGREPTVSELAELCGIPEEEAIVAMDAGAAPVSLDEPVKDGEGLTRADALSSEENISDIERIALKDSISTLPAEDRALITLRYFCGKTQQQTAEKLGMTQVQVSRREKKLLERLRSSLL